MGIILHSSRSGCFDLAPVLVASPDVSKIDGRSFEFWQGHLSVLTNVAHAAVRLVTRYIPVKTVYLLCANALAHRPHSEQG
jgi:hypothetical protein